MSGVEVNKRRDQFPSAVIIDSISVVGGIQKELLNAEFRKIRFHREKRMEKRKHIMPGSPLQKREYRKVTAGIGGHIYVEVVAEEIAFPVGVPSPVAVRLGIMTSAVTGRTVIFPAVTDPLFALLSGSADRSAITGKSQMVWIDQPIADRELQELLLIKPGNKGKRIPGF